MMAKKERWASRPALQKSNQDRNPLSLMSSGLSLSLSLSLSLHGLKRIRVVVPLGYGLTFLFGELGIEEALETEVPHSTEDKPEPAAQSSS